MILTVRDSLIELFPRLARVPPEVAEDCVGEGMLDVITAYDPVAVDTTVNDQFVKKETVIFMLMKSAASKYLGRERKHMAQTMSDDTPIGPEKNDGEWRMRDLFVPRQNSAERIENYAEWMMFWRKGGCPLTKEEINGLFGFA